VAGEFPDVAVQRQFVAVRAQWALEEAAIGAELLVVGCHRRDDHWFSRLGPVASWLLHRSPCPIAVVGRPSGADSVAPVVAAATVTHDELASAGPGLEEKTPAMPSVAPVVVGIDGSPASERALRWGIDQALALGVPLRLVTVYRWALSYPWEIAYKVRVSELEEMRHQAGQALKHASELVSALQQELAMTAEAIEGSPVTVLLDESHHASMLVLGSRQTSTFGAVALGSVATAVSARAQCPVVVLRGPASGPMEDAAVVVGIDGSGHSESVLEFGFDYASRNGLPLTAILCWKGDRMIAPWRPQTPPNERAESWLADTVAGWREKYPDVVVRTAVIGDDAIPGLVANSTEESLLVVGTRGRHALAGTLLGSVSQGVLHHAVCPVAVVPSHSA
jgi:nucleotide-binding universal stress UspA family protein